MQNKSDTWTPITLITSCGEIYKHQTDNVTVVAIYLVEEFAYDIKELLSNAFHHIVDLGFKDDRHS